MHLICKTLCSTFHLSHDMIKPTKWVCAQRRLRAGWASAQSDQNIRCPLSACRPRTLILFVLSFRGSFECLLAKKNDPIIFTCGASSEFVSSSIPPWQILTAHAQPFRGARDLAFCLKVPLDSLLVWASSGGSGETARMRRLAWSFAARIDDKYQIRLTRPTLFCLYFEEVGGLKSKRWIEPRQANLCLRAFRHDKF